MTDSLLAAPAFTNLAGAFPDRPGDMPAHPARGVAAVATRAGDRSKEDIPVGPDVVPIVRVKNPDGEEVEEPADEGVVDQMLTKMVTGKWGQPALCAQGDDGPARQYQPRHQKEVTIQ